jgi:hypothetical protein
LIYGTGECESEKKASMANLSIPERYRPGLANLRTLSDDLFLNLLTALEGCPPTASSKELATRISTEIPGITKDELRDITRAVIGLYFVRGDAGVSIEKLAMDVCDAMRSAGSEDLSLSDSEYPKFKDRLEKVLAVKSLSYASKAAGLRDDFERTFCRAKILTDVRPVFEDPGEAPVGAVITHTLKLGYHEGEERDEHKDIYIALDSEDISTLQRVLARAENKAISLQALLKKSEVPDLDVKS